VRFVVLVDLLEIFGWMLGLGGFFLGSGGLVLAVIVEVCFFGRPGFFEGCVGCGVDAKRSIGFMEVGAELACLEGVLFFRWIVFIVSGLA
jgi:hypothetical protein